MWQQRSVFVAKQVQEFTRTRFLCKSKIKHRQRQGFVICKYRHLVMTSIFLQRVLFFESIGSLPTPLLATVTQSEVFEMMQPIRRELFQRFSLAAYILLFRLSNLRPWFLVPIMLRILCTILYLCFASTELRLPSLSN